MEIIIEKNNSEDIYSISRNELEIIIDCLPKEWFSGIKRIIISNQLFQNSFEKNIAEVNHSRLIIRSRGIEKERVIASIVEELYLGKVDGTKVKFGPGGPQLTKQSKKDSKEFINSLIKIINERLHK